MKLNKLAAFAVLAISSGSVLADVGGGATIHNAASMSFSGGQVTASVNVSVLTIGTAPTFTAADQSANGGESVNLTYNITSNSNGSDVYDLAVTTNDTNVTAPSSLSVTPTPITLGASITSRWPTANTIYIAAGSEANLTAGDEIRINIGGTDFFYDVDSVTPGTPASTLGNTTTPETPTALVLTPQAPAPAISGNGVSTGNVPLGTQIGETQDFVVSITAGNPTTPGTDGTHEVVIDGTTTEPGPGGPGDVISFSDVGSSDITVLSGNATLVKEVRNVTEGGAFATTGVTARTGDVLEYRLTATPIPGETVTGAEITDSIPEHATYVNDSTTLNAVAVPDPVVGESAVETGLEVNSASGGAGEIVDGESAIVIFQVTVD